jgi:hypothetical protein
MKKLDIRSIGLIILMLIFVSCKSEDTSLDLLGGDTGTSDLVSVVEDLEIISSIPEGSNITIEIGQSRDFAITAIAPAGNTVVYSWTYDGSPVAAVNTYQITGALPDVGNHTLIASATDGVTTKTRTWNIKINGPPTVTNVTTGTPTVAFDASINITASATDPNSDSLTYEWFLNGATSPQLTGSGPTGTLTGAAGLVGPNTVTVEVSDGTQTNSYTWDVEVNYFPQACNELTTGQICTYAGSPHKGNGLAFNNAQYPLRFRPRVMTQDALGNLFIGDLDHNVVWYWNNTAAPVTRMSQVIAPGVVQVVAGTGEDASGPAGVPATQSPLNSPEGLWYDDASDRLYISETGGNQVKYVDTNGIVFVGLGGGASHLDGDTAFTHDCDSPRHLYGFGTDLYVACYNEHRVKRWDLSSDLAYTVAGDGDADDDGEDVAATAGGVRRPHGLFVDANGIYITLYDRQHVRFVNTTGAPIVFWNGNPDQVTVNPGNIATIMGDGGNGGTPTPGDPLSSDVGEPTSVWGSQWQRNFLWPEGDLTILC